MPARKKKLRISRRVKRKSLPYKKKKAEFKKRLLFYGVIFTILSGIFVFLITSRNFWNGKDKLSIVINRGDQVGVLVCTFDPGMEEISTIDIPGNTQVDVARNLGVWKLGNIWKLGENENLEGLLLAETVTRHFKFPVYAWADKEAVGFSEQSFLALIRAVISPYKTNLSIADRLAIAFFSARVANMGRVNVNLAETGYLTKTKFIDGSEGYVVSRSPSNRILSTFADTEISKEEYKLIIKDASGKAAVAREVGEILEVLGAKVVSIIKLDDDSIDCFVSGGDKKIVKKVARLFSCDTEEENLDGGFDLEITIGTRFTERF